MILGAFVASFMGGKVGGKHAKVAKVIFVGSKGKKRPIHSLIIGRKSNFSLLFLKDVEIILYVILKHGKKKQFMYANTCFNSFHSNFNGIKSGFHQV